MLRQDSACTGQPRRVAVGRFCRYLQTLKDICASRRAFALLRSELGVSEDNLKAFISTMGNTQVLQREAEAALGDVVRKGAVAQQRMAAQEEQLGRAPTLAEAAAEQARHIRAPAMLRMCTA